MNEIQGGRNAVGATHCGVKTLSPCSRESCWRNPDLTKSYSEHKIWGEHQVSQCPWWLPRPHQCCIPKPFFLWCPNFWPSMESRMACLHSSLQTPNDPSSPPQPSSCQNKPGRFCECLDSSRAWSGLRRKTEKKQSLRMLICLNFSTNFTTQRNQQRQAGNKIISWLLIFQTGEMSPGKYERVIKCSQGRERANFFCLLPVHVLKAQQEYKQARRYDRSDTWMFKGKRPFQTSLFYSVLYMYLGGGCGAHMSWMVCRGQRTIC